MTKKKIERISVIHREKILWLKWYFLRDKGNSKYSVLERKIFDAAENHDMLAYRKYSTIKQITDIRVQTSETDILETVKEVYVYNRMNVIGACQRILFVSQSPAYVKLNKWFETYSDLYFSIIPVSDISAYHELVSN
ncbi:hypothetical protein VYI37_05000 [Streptococcus anginosus]|uniref:Uncharacterized protein n=1 Tax=Streptococcus anginosus TaxID=1328 RepID=A0A6G4MY32_STRAP|nr:hypothetical protein [Streptococcus anginosus]KAA9316997.1 hypothetical protein F6H96_02260 [Streptococcus anginosus]MCW0987412.1 hypothetical protein [Streptococcus anginosus]MCW1041960.1 hypothetical protein [Streptococcus anginosus]MED5766314.1 hypothetical protein [Streptococcus anginosus]MED5839207.1 hypothetical protein [Streptococcus anginosus]